MKHVVYGCPDCQGDGQCTACAGKGEVLGEHGDDLYKCVECKGSGICSTCGGGEMMESNPDYAPDHENSF